MFISYHEKTFTQPLFSYKRSMTKNGFFRKHEYVYDEYYDCYICPANKILKYSTTNREGYREYKSNGRDCELCPYHSQCTESRNHVKVITRHLWEPYMEQAEDIRHTLGMKALYDRRKETIERIFGTVKEYHGFRYTNMIGKARMTMKAALTYACINLKKLAKIKGGNPSLIDCLMRLFQDIANFNDCCFKQNKVGSSRCLLNLLCLRSETP